MTAPFIDPIIYPGTPMPMPGPGRWVRLQDYALSATCALGGEILAGDDVVGWNGSAWECRECAHRERTGRRRRRFSFPKGSVVWEEIGVTDEGFRVLRGDGDAA